MSSPSPEPSPPQKCKKRNQFFGETSEENESPLFFTPPIKASGSSNNMSPLQDKTFDNSGGFDDDDDDFNDDPNDDFNDCKEKNKPLGVTLKMNNYLDSFAQSGTSNTPVLDYSEDFISQKELPPVGKDITPINCIHEEPKQKIAPHPSWVFDSTRTCGISRSYLSYDSSPGDSPAMSVSRTDAEDSDAQLCPTQQIPLRSENSIPKFIKRITPTKEVAHSVDNANTWLIHNHNDCGSKEQSEGETKMNKSTDQLSSFPSKTSTRFRQSNMYGDTRKKCSEVIGGKTVCMYGRRYVIGEQIGEGSFAKVIEAYDTMARKVVAIKINRENLIKSSMGKELRTLNELTHNKNNDNVVSLMDHWSNEDRSKQFIAMTYTPCGTLKKLLEQIPNHKLPLPQARCYFRCLINGLSYIHSRGFFHRDIKADNLLLINERSLLITDFGTATKKLQTKGGGAPGYQPPELAKSGLAPSTAKQDIWAAGITLYIMVIGHFPFELGTLAKIYEEIARCEFDFHEDSLPGDLVTLLKGILHPDPYVRMSLEEIMDSAWMKANDGENDGSVKFVVPSRIPTAFNEDFISKIEAFTTY